MQRTIGILLTTSLWSVTAWALSVPQPLPAQVQSQQLPQDMSQITAAIELQLAREQYSSALRAVQGWPDYENSPRGPELQAKALLGLQRYQEAEVILSSALLQHPQSSNLHLLSALNQFALAEQAGLFSVGRYVKTGLASLQLAARLAPEDVDIQLKLLGFYLDAPGFMGGDSAKARQIVKVLQAGEPADAAIASSMLLLHDKQLSQALALLQPQLQRTPDHVRLLVHTARVFALDQQDIAAFPLYLRAAELAGQASLQHQYLYQAARSAAAVLQEASADSVGFSTEQFAAAITASQQVIAFYQDSEGQSLHWARAKLAQLYLAGANVTAAQQQLAQLLVVAAPQDRLAQEIKKLQRQLKKHL